MTHAPTHPPCVVFAADQLLPDAWRHLAGDGPVRTFNPGLLRDGDGWLFAYRLVASDGARRIGLCRLDSALNVIPGSTLPLTDHVCFDPRQSYPEVATRWFADPRLYRFDGRVFVYWNSGWHEPHNCQFLQELHPTTLLPLGHPRELALLDGERRKLEKNWAFFDAGAPGRVHAIYSVTPHRVLEFALDGDGPLAGEEVAHTEWTLDNYPASHGGLRGGAPPCLAEGRFWSFCHSVHDGADGYRYLAAAYTFAARAPFAPTARPRTPLTLGNPFGGRRTHERLNPAVGEVIYPCGAAFDGSRWLVSHGLNDEYCAISTLAHADVVSTLEPLGGAGP